MRPAFALCYFALCPLYLAPLLATRFLPAFDLPHHLAIADALAKAGDPASPYARLFSVGLEVAPFDTHFAALVAASAWMPLTVAVKLLVGLQVLALPLVSARLLRACERSPLPALLTFPLGYSMPLHYGLVAFVLAVPLLIWVFAEAVDRAAWSARPRRQAALLAGLLCLLFFTHLEAWAVGVLGATVAVALGPVRGAARGLGVAAVLPSLAPFALYFARIAKEPSFASAPAPARVLIAERLRELGEHGVLRDLYDRARGVPVHLLRGFHDGSDVIASFSYLALVALLALLAWRGFERPRPSPAAWLGVTAAFAYFGLPHHALPHAYSVYPRFAVVLAVVLLVLIPKRLARLAPRAENLVALALACASALYGLNLTRQYAAFGRELADFERVLDAVPAGRASGGLVFDAESKVVNVGGLFTGAPAYYATERRSPRSSTYLYYCAWPQLPCRMRQPERPPPLPFFSYPAQLDPRRALAEIDLFLVRGGPAAERIFGSETPRVRLIAEHGSWRAFLRN